MRPPRPPKTVVDYDYILTSPKFHTEGIGSEVLKKYLQEHGEDIYHITIEGKEYQIKVKYLINFITIDNKFYEFFYNGHSPQIPLEYFKYAVLMFFQEKNADLDLENNEMIQQRLKQIENDEELQLINKYNKPNDPNLSKIRVNPKLREAILKDMPNYHGLKLLEAIYIYVKLCKLLTYDDEFFATNQKGESAKVHEEIARISQITPENNKVVCYEFASIYEAMLNEFGIPCEIS